MRPAATPGGRRSGPVPARPDRRQWWRVDCRDLANSRSFLTVLINRDRVVLVAPPGHSAVLRSSHAGELSAALRDAAAQAGK